MLPVQCVRSSRTSTPSKTASFVQKQTTCTAASCKSRVQASRFTSEASTKQLKAFGKPSWSVSDFLKPKTDTQQVTYTCTRITHTRICTHAHAHAHAHVHRQPNTRTKHAPYHFVPHGLISLDWICH